LEKVLDDPGELMIGSVYEVKFVIVLVRSARLDIVHRAFLFLALFVFLGSTS
jgi:hypothetical protein